jgi:phenylpropionate dioxygenase-like ring-hydroxylating dioxygenase large terminal subunit
MPTLVELEKTLPAKWYIDPDQFELEKRAIFAKTWHLVTHKSRFDKPGSYVSTTIAGFPIFLSLGKDGQIKAYHNVCRHRASPVIQKEAGSQLVVGCAYQYVRTR